MATEQVTEQSTGHLIRLERLGATLRVVLDRPAAHNALSAAMLDELLAAIAAAGADPEVRAVILTGAGERAFSAGADVREMSRLSPPEARAFAERGHRVADALEELPKLVVAAINGVALGGGCELALACDVRLASERARLGQPEVGIGIIPGWGGTLRLPRLVGEGIARELILTGRVLEAAEALRLGLVNAVVPAEALADEALRLASAVAARAPLAVGLAKRALLRGRATAPAAAAELEADLFALCFATADQREGMAAFLEKRRPEFTGR